LVAKELIAAYKSAKYIVNIDSGESRIYIDKPCPAVDVLLNSLEAENAYFITPENPFSMTLSKQKNILRHQRFTKIMKDSNYTFYDGYGTNEDETWPREKSYLIVCDDANKMHKLASDFGQNGLLRLTYQSAVRLFILKPLRYIAI
jgi:hypothetical protein